MRKILIVLRTFSTDLWKRVFSWTRATSGPKLPSAPGSSATGGLSKTLQAMSKHYWAEHLKEQQERDLRHADQCFELKKSMATSTSKNSNQKKLLVLGENSAIDDLEDRVSADLKELNEFHQALNHNIEEEPSMANKDDDGVEVKLIKTREELEDVIHDFIDKVERKRIEATPREAGSGPAPERPREELPRRKDVVEHLGSIAPCKPQLKAQIAEDEGMTPEQMNHVIGLSYKLQDELRAVMKKFVEKELKDLPYIQKTYAVTDTLTALIADWSCSPETIASSTMDIPSALMSSCELLQYNFTERQKVLFDEIGRYVH